METTAFITLDLQRLTYNRIRAKQNDTWRRRVNITVLSDGLPLKVAESSEFVVQYRKPDGTKGFYTHLPDGTVACTSSLNDIYMTMAPQMLTVAGEVSCSIAMMDAQHQILQTFSFYIDVEESENEGASSDDYLNAPTLQNLVNLVDGVNKKVESLEETTENLNIFSVMIRDELFKGKTILYSYNFVQGLYTFGVGIEPSDYWITTNPAIPVKAGNKITINPNGCRVTVRMMDSSNILESTIAKVLGTVEGETAELTAQADGWLCFLVMNATKLTPETYPCEISVGESEIYKLRAEIEELRKNTPSPMVLSRNLKHRPPISIVDDCQSTADWRITNTSTDVPTVDTEGHIMFDQCLHSDSQMRCLAKTYDLLKNNIVLKIKVNSIAEGATLYLRLRNKELASKNASYVIMLGNVNAATGVWLDIAVPYNGHYAVNGNPDFSNINDVELYARGGAVDWNLQYIGIMPKGLDKGLISFTFDDGYKSQYTGIKILAEKGITGTVYPSSLTIPEGTADYMTVQELQELVSLYGTHIGMHHSTVYDQMTLEELANHWAEYQRAMKEAGLGDGRHMAYPGGRHPAEVVQIARGYFDSCRTINGFAHAETFPPVDNYRLKAVSSIGAAGNNVEYVKDKIDRAIASSSWLILVFHRIEDGDTTMYCSESDLSAIAEYAIASGAKIMNIAEVFDSTVTLK